jgi:site-specific DNA recombinase
MRACGYVRVSTDEQVADGWNLAEDRKRIAEIADANGWELTDIYDDGGRQGDDPTRPGLLAMLAGLDEIDVVILRSQDRLSRDLGIWAMCSTAFRKAEVRVETFGGTLDLHTPQGEFFNDLMACVGKLEKRTIGVRVKQAKGARARAGGHPGGKRPYGYRQRDVTEDGNPTGPLIVDPAEKAVVRRMFEMADAGASQRQIARTLNAEGIPASRGGRWAPSTVNRVLGSPLYLGKIRRRGADDRYELHNGQHEAIVNEALWQRVNRSRATPERRAGGRPLKSGHLLTRGGLRCGSCGSAMIPVASYDGRPETYKCIGRRDHGPGHCRMPQQRRDRIDGALLTELTSRYFDLDGTRDRLRARIESEVPEAQTAVQDALRAQAEAESRIAKVVRGWQDEILADDEYQRQRTDLDAERDGADAALEQAERKLAQVEANGTTTDAEEALLSHLADLKRLVSTTVEQSQDTEALRTVIRTLFSRVILRTWSWDDLDEIEAAGVSAGDGLFLVPVLREGVADWSSLPPKINQVPVPGEVTTSRCR